MPCGKKKRPKNKYGDGPRRPVKTTKKERKS